MAQITQIKTLLLRVSLIEYMTQCGWLGIHL